MANASRVPAEVLSARKALATGNVVPAPGNLSATPTSAELIALRGTVAGLQAALVKAGIIKAS